MAKKKLNEEALTLLHEDNTFRQLLSEREKLFEEIKESGGEIPDSYLKNEEAIAKKTDDYGYVNTLFEREIEKIEADIKPFQRIVDIGRQKIRNLQFALAQFKAYTCDLIEEFGESGGADGKKRVLGDYFWIKSQKKEVKEPKLGVDVPEEYQIAVVEIPLDEYRQFYSHLKIKEVKYQKDLPDEYCDKVVKKSVTFFENTKAKDIQNE